MTEREIFEAVRSFADPAARQAKVAELCADNSALRAHVERLLHVDGERHCLLDAPALPGVDLKALIETRNLNAGATVELFAERTFHPFLSPPTQPSSLGRIGHYDLFQCLGHGGFGAVFRAHDEILQRTVALKIMYSHLAMSVAARRRFLREAQSAAAIKHVNVVGVHAVEEQPLPFLVMEYVQGETLQQRLDRDGPMPASEVVRIGCQLAAGLAAAHATGLIHRDVKPANVLIEHGPTEQVKLTDFGLARAIDDASISQSALVSGTPMFMSPEQSRGDRVDHRTDLFSLGSVLYMMITGRPPFRAESTLAVLRQVCEEDALPIARFAPKTPAWLVETIAALHAKNPGRRIQTADELIERLERPVATKTKPFLFHRRLVAAAVVLALVVSFVSMIWTPEPNTRRAEAHDEPKEKPAQIPAVDNDRAAAEWVFSVGVPAMTLKVDDTLVKITSDEQRLPEAPFQLYVLNLNRHPNVTDEGLAALNGLQHLEWLQLTNVNVTNEGLRHLKNCKNLKKLMLYGTKITDEGLVHLAGMTKLLDLSVKSTKVTEAGVRSLAKSLPQCTIEWNRGTIPQSIAGN